MKKKNPNQLMNQRLILKKWLIIPKNLKANNLQMLKLMITKKQIKKEVNRKKYQQAIKS